jgi:putative photosynthetic complex assembly protein
MTAAPADRSFPRGAVLGAAGLVALSVLAALAGGAADRPGVLVPDGAGTGAERGRLLRFVDRDDGSVGVIDARTGRLAATLAPGEDGFARGALRGLARERKRRGIGDGPPFVLFVQPDGRLVLTDPETARAIDLGAFGPTNSAAFARLLSAGGGQP